MTADERRSARLLFAAELRAGTVTAADLDRPAVADAVMSRRVPSLAARWIQRRSLGTGRLTLQGDLVEPLAAARRAVLGEAAAGPPRLLVRADEIPNVKAADDPAGHGTDMSRRFHHTLRDAGVPYLAAVLPRVAHDALDPDEGRGHRDLTADEIELLQELRRDGVVFGQHALDHRSRHRSPRRRSELTGLSDDALEQRLETGAGILREHGLHAPVFVPPFNRFGRRQWRVLARHFDVVCGGPESVPLMGFHRAPLWRGDAVWLPSYPPLYGRARDLLGPVEALGDATGVWLCLTLHPGWEAEDGWEPLRLLCERIAPMTRPWDEFLADVDLSRQAA